MVNCVLASEFGEAKVDSFNFGLKAVEPLGVIPDRRFEYPQRLTNADKNASHTEECQKLPDIKKEKYSIRIHQRPGATRQVSYTSDGPAAFVGTGFWPAACLANARESTITVSPTRAN
jgi:hypothetical protein